jgi:hypothetical protein
MFTVLACVCSVILNKHRQSLQFYFILFTFNYIGARWFPCSVSCCYHSMDEYISDDDILNTTESSIVSNQKGRYECVKRDEALSDASIYSVLGTRRCLETRVSTTNTYNFKCSGCCLEQLGSSIAAFDSVKQIREYFWVNPLKFKDALGNSKETREIAGTSIRNCLFIQYMFNSVATNENGAKGLRFMVGSVEVCKFFFWKVSGLCYKTFIKGFNYVLQYENLDRKTSSFDNLINSKLFKIVCGAIPTITAINLDHVINAPNPRIIQTDLRKESALAFLDTFFVNYNGNNNEDVDYAPELANVRYVRCCWTKVYQKYEDHCKTLGIKSLTYQKFCTLRYVL